MSTTPTELEDEWTLVHATVYVRRADREQAADLLHKVLTEHPLHETDLDVAQVWT